MINSTKFNYRVKKYIKLYESKYSMKNVFYIYYKILNEVLIINEVIKKNVYKFIKKYNGISFIGIQIRVGNDDLREKQYMNSSDVDVMINLAKKNFKYKKWFLTADSQKLRIKLSKKYEKIITYSTNITLHYERSKKDSTIIIENEILSKSKLLIISKSTYGLIALLKSGLLLNDENNLAYEIKQGYSYNIPYYFNQFMK